MNSVRKHCKRCCGTNRSSRRRRTTSHGQQPARKAAPNISDTLPHPKSLRPRTDSAGLNDHLQQSRCCLNHGHTADESRSGRTATWCQLIQYIIKKLHTPKYMFTLSRLYAVTFGNSLQSVLKRMLLSQALPKPVLFNQAGSQ